MESVNSPPKSFSNSVSDAAINQLGYSS